MTDFKLNSGLGHLAEEGNFFDQARKKGEFDLLESSFFCPSVHYNNRDFIIHSKIRSFITAIGVFLLFSCLLYSPRRLTDESLKLLFQKPLPAR